MIYFVVGLIYFIANCIVAGIMTGVAKQKGHERSLSFVLVLFFGIIGCVYVLALPDMIQRKQNEDIITILLALKEKSEHGTDKM